MSRLQRLIRVLACRTGLRTGKNVKTNGNLPLTKQGTFGGFPLSDYGFRGAAQAGLDPSPESPDPPKFVGEAILPDNERGLSFVLSTSDPSGGGERVSVTFPGVEPLRAISGVYDEIGFAAGKLIRRVGVCRDPVVSPGLEETAGTDYPSVSLLIGDGTTVPTYPNLLCAHWKKIRGRDFGNGDTSGMIVSSGMVYANLPREKYRRYVKGCVGDAIETRNLFAPSISPGEYRCDFFDGTSRVFTLTEGMLGNDYCRDVLAVSRSGATLKRNALLYVFTGTEDADALSDYGETGETLFRLAKTDYGAKADGYASVSSVFSYAEEMTPLEMIEEYYDEYAFCEDEDYWYFYLPGKTTLSDFRTYLAGRSQAGRPISVVYAAAETTETVLTSRLADTATVGNVPLLPAVTDDYAFDLEGALTLVPAMREFIAEERASGRQIEIFYVLPVAEVTETEIGLPTLHSYDGATTFSVSSAQAGGIDPAVGWFTAPVEDTP